MLLAQVCMCQNNALAHAGIHCQFIYLVMLACCMGQRFESLAEWLRRPQTLQAYDCRFNFASSRFNLRSSSEQLALYFFTRVSVAVWTSVGRSVRTTVGTARKSLSAKHVTKSVSKPSTECNRDATGGRNNRYGHRRYGHLVMPRFVYRDRNLCFDIPCLSAATGIGRWKVSTRFPACGKVSRHIWQIVSFTVMRGLGLDFAGHSRRHR